MPLQDDLVGDARLSLLVLLGAVALVLLIACANLANLLLVRTHGRAKEIALRGALGASRARVVQQLLAEGAAARRRRRRRRVRWPPPTAWPCSVAIFGTALPRAQEVAVDGARAGVHRRRRRWPRACSRRSSPAWQLSGRDANEALKQGASRGSSSAGDGRVRQVLVVSEVALALMLLIGAGLLMRSLSSLRAVDPGFDAAQRAHGVDRHPDGEVPSTERSATSSSTACASASRALPGRGVGGVDRQPAARKADRRSTSRPRARRRSRTPSCRRSRCALPSPGYFATARIPLAGRPRLHRRPTRFGKPGVIIVSERTAQRFWPGENPIGKHVTLKMMSHEPREVVGVVGEVKMDGARRRHRRLGNGDLRAGGAVRASTVRRWWCARPCRRSRWREPMVGAVHAIDPEQPVLDIQTMQRVVEESLGQRPFAMRLLAAFAALALMLASVGIYSVLAYTVRQRVREIGIRMALGAPSAGVLRMVVVDGLKPTLAGVALGLVLAAALVRVMETLLFGVSPYDPGTFTLVAAIVAGVGLVATLIPAYRATRVDPIVTLRAE